MDTGVIRNKRQAQELCDRILKMRLPFKYFMEPIYPIRAINWNNYYWGVVLKYISDESGHSVDECHEAYKKKLNYKGEFEFNEETDQYEFKVSKKSSVMDQRKFIEYVCKVRIDGELEHHIVIPMPNETFVSELKFETEK